MNLTEIRKAANMTQKSIAEKAGLSRAGYANIENGSRKPSVFAAKRIAAVLGVNWTEFYDDDGESA